MIPNATVDGNIVHGLYRNTLVIIALKQYQKR
jgi:hypothetical protein